MAYQRSNVRIQLDDLPSFECSMLMLAVCNGQYFGGRMHVAPMAKIDDDLLDVVLFRDFTLFDALFKFRKIYTGGHLLDKNVHYVQAKKVVIEPLERRKVKIEADGEVIGSLPVTFELIKTHISIII
ncbi:MAG: diacylglycerol/lipid kinase family protein [Legionella sp.]